MSGASDLGRSLRSTTSAMMTPSSSTLNTQMAIPGPSTAPPALVPSGEIGAHVHKTKKAAPSMRSKMPGSLDVLKDCTIFVDVRTEDGEDAGGLFVDMLRGLGAKVLMSILTSEEAVLIMTSQ